jgi:hypothetical protein
MSRKTAKAFKVRFHARTGPSQHLDAPIKLNLSDLVGAHYEQAW